MSPWRQRFKWAVYALLFIDFLLYLYQDIESARYTLDVRSSLLEVLAAYVTSIDLVAWFSLILLFELETYVLVGRGWTGATKWVVQGVRLVCYVTILHTSFSYDIALGNSRIPNDCRRPPTSAPMPEAGASSATATTSRSMPAIARPSAGPGVLRAQR